MWRRCRTGAEVNITSEFGGFGQVRMHLFSIINLAEFVIITTRVRGCILDRKRDILPQVVSAVSRRADTRAVSRQIFLMPFPCR